MHVVVYARDKPDSVDLRLATRPAHLEYFTAIGSRLRTGGPLMDADTGKPKGSMMILEVESLDEAAEIMANDPYAKAGLFDTVEITPWTWVFGKPADLEG